MGSKWFSGMVLVVMVVSCVDPVNLNNDQAAPKIVIDGFFTDNAGLNTVRISKSASFSNNNPFVPFNEPVKGAVVRVITEGGSQTFAFTEASPGIHKTTGAGVPGQSYYLEVVMPDGTVYTSSPEVIPPPVGLDDLTFTLDEQLIIDESSGSRVELTRHFFNIYANVNDPAADENYYLWKTSGTFEYQTKPIGDSPCLYCLCWADIDPLQQHVTVLSDDYINGGILKYHVASVLYDRMTRYLIRAHQLSIGKKAHTFWNSINKQQTTTGSIFDPMPQTIKGNMYRKDGTDEVVLGFFTTAGVAAKNIMIRRGEEAAKRGVVDRNLLPIWEGDCRNFYTGATHIRPEEFYE